MEQAEQIRRDLGNLRVAIQTNDMEKGVDAVAGLLQNFLLDVHCIAVALMRISKAEETE